jgi:hypothetical protein
MDPIAFNPDKLAYNTYTHAKNLVYKFTNVNIFSLIFHNNNVIMLYVKR